MADFISRIAPKSEVGSQSQILNVDIHEETWAAATKTDDDPHRKNAQKVEQNHEDDDIFYSDDEVSLITESTSRERRSAFMILKCLQHDGLL